MLFSSPVSAGYRPMVEGVEPPVGEAETTLMEFPDPSVQVSLLKEDNNIIMMVPERRFRRMDLTKDLNSEDEAHAHLLFSEGQLCGIYEASVDHGLLSGQEVVPLHLPLDGVSVVQHLVLSVQLQSSD